MHGILLKEKKKKHRSTQSTGKKEDNTLINIFAAPLLRKVGSRLEYIIRIDFPLRGVKFSTSIALAAVNKQI